MRRMLILMYSDSMVPVFPLRPRLSSTGKRSAPSIFMHRMLIQMHSDSLVPVFSQTTSIQHRYALRALYLHARYTHPNAVIPWYWFSLSDYVFLVQVSTPRPPSSCAVYSSICSDSLVLVFPLRLRLSSTSKHSAPSIFMCRMLIQMHSDSRPRPRLSCTIKPLVTCHLVRLSLFRMSSIFLTSIWFRLCLPDGKKARKT